MVFLRSRWDLVKFELNWDVVVFLNNVWNLASSNLVRNEKSSVLVDHVVSKTSQGYSEHRQHQSPSETKQTLSTSSLIWPSFQMQATILHRVFLLEQMLNNSVIFISIATFYFSLLGFNALFVCLSTLYYPYCLPRTSGDQAGGLLSSV